MVHLTSVASDATAKRGSVVEGMENIKIDEPAEDESLRQFMGLGLHHKSSPSMKCQSAKCLRKLLTA